MTIIDNFVGHKNWVDTCDDRFQLYWECTNSKLPSIVLESICSDQYFIRVSPVQNNTVVL